MMREKEFMKEAIALSRKNLNNNAGGPFGCVIVKDNVIIGRGYNQVTETNDPTAHAEMVAIRDACKNLQSFQLEGCEIYTSCEPCPMCLGAIYWARPSVIYYGNTRADAKEVGFDDSMIYEEVNKPLDQRIIPAINLEREEANKVFEEWAEKEDKTIY
ncbi:MAG: nucleoside deaminase [Ginsengibacter sp.]